MLVFKGTDIHGGFAPSETQKERQEWYKTNLKTAWDIAGPENRIGYVCYATSATVNRNAGANMTLAIPFGNFGPTQLHRSQNLNFAEDGHTVLGGDEGYSIRHAWEVSWHFLKYMQMCGLELDIPPGKSAFERILRGFSFKLTSS